MVGKKADHIKGPDLMHSATEGVRTGMELFRSVAQKTLPALALGGRSEPLEEGAPVLVIQGFAMHDWTTLTLRHHLDSLGHDSFDPDIGFNLGVRGNLIERMEQRLEEIADKHPGRRISVVGHSLGGIQGLLLSYRHPDLIDRLVTMGSPFGAAQSKGGANRIVYGAYEFLNPDDAVLSEELESYIAEGRPHAAVTSIYSPFDGVIAPAAAVNPWGDEGVHRAENIEVQGSHCGMIVNVDVWDILADRLSTSHENWRTFNWENTAKKTALPLDLAPVKG